MLKNILTIYKLIYFYKKIIFLLQIFSYSFFSLIAYCNEIVEENTEDSLSTEQWVGASIIVVGVLITFSGFGNIFKPSDGRTKTGYKNNEEPKVGKGCLQIIIGPIVILFGSVPFMSDV